MEDVEKIVSTAELENVWGYADFGNVSKRDVVRFALLKSASGYVNGRTAHCIIQELGLIGTRGTLTKKGKAYLWEAFKKDNF